MTPTQLPADSYDGPGDGRFYSPFHLRVLPMARLLLINWQDGRYYKGLEPQCFDDDVTGRGLLVIAYRQDGKVDVYHQPALRPQRDSFQIEGGVGEIVPRDFERSRLAIGPRGMDADIAFTDLAGRRIEVKVRERIDKPPEKVALLAPAGHSIAAPTSLPLFFMYDFAFVRVPQTELALSVDGEPRALAKLPARMGGAQIYITRYCGDPFISFWNPATSGPLPGREIDGPGAVLLDGTRYDVVENAGHFEIARMFRSLPGRDGRPARGVTISFTPPVPAVTGLRDGASAGGTFRISSAPLAGHVDGEWHMARLGNEVKLSARPGGWQPGERSRTARFIFTILRFFRTWPGTYEWNATIARDAPGGPAISSVWRRL